MAGGVTLAEPIGSLFFVMKIKLKEIHTSGYKRTSPSFTLPERDTELCAVQSHVKTEELESCALVLAALTHPASRFEGAFKSAPFDVTALLIEPGRSTAELQGWFTVDGKEKEVTLTINSDGSVKIGGTPDTWDDAPKLDDLIGAITGASHEPVIREHFQYYPLHRRVTPFNPDLNALFNAQAMQHVSRFKRDILIAQMDASAVLDTSAVGGTREDSCKALDYFQSLLDKFVVGGAKMDKTRIASDNSLAIMLQYNGGSMPFDALGAGEKDAIVTLFSIWKNTPEDGAVVLIDEPTIYLDGSFRDGYEFFRVLDYIDSNSQYIYTMII